ncbi:F-box protein At5g51380-like [Phalaenopsis equestris]|uniref:F-box protein At5g51380-like n=1 Tax=Phalaenopsis equestris TaxID=78828 RepID=UPI0009E3FD42|nr:F-box protein At5g51380-like [Phalaenopsis equestris]
MHKTPRRHRLRSSPDLFLPDKPSFKNVVFKMQLADQALNRDPSTSRASSPSPSPCRSFGHDATALLSDELLLHILSAVRGSHLGYIGLVSKRWLRLVDRLRRSLTLLDWSFLAGHSRRLTTRFRELTEVDLVPAAFRPPSSFSPVILTRGPYSLHMDPISSHSAGELPFLDSEAINNGLDVLAHGCPHLQRLCTVAPLESEFGLATAALECTTLQELELHRCSDTALRPISAFQNLQILRLVASLDGLYSGPGVSDIGLTILAHGCKRLVKLELGGCEASFDGISAIGRCCPMLEELAICDDSKMEEGWLAALSYCVNLKTLRLQSCRKIVSLAEPMEHLGCCPTIERLLLQRCQLRDRRSLKALFVVCEYVKEIGFQYCWGLDNDMFSISSICRRVKLLSLEGCSKITTEGLESVLLSWNDLQSLTIISCNGIRDDEVSPALSGLFSILKQFRWRPDSKSVLSMNLQGTGMGKKGGRFFRRFRG